MASPFAAFRKRQKLWMAIACLLAIIAFVFLQNLSLLDMRGGGQEDPVVVKTKTYGNLKRSDLGGPGGLLWKKQKVRAVIADLIAAAEPGLPQQQVEGFLNSQFGTVSQEQLVDTWLRLQRAKELGLKVSDENVSNFLELCTARRVPPERIHEIIAREPVVSDAQFYDLLREELLARRVMQIFALSLQAGGQPIATPSQRWDWYNRLKRKAVTEAIPLSVADYVNQVKSPKDAVLEQFFNKYKNNIPNPTSPEPGFKHPQKAKFQYFKGEVAKFEAKVTDAEIVKEYEKNKEAYDERFKIRSGSQLLRNDLGPALRGEKNQKREVTKPAQPPKVEKEKAVPKATSPTAESKLDAKKPAIENGATAPKETPKAEPKKPADSKGASAAVDSPFMLVAMQQSDKSADKSGKAPPAPAPSTKPAANTEPPTTKSARQATEPKKPAAKPEPAPKAKTPEEILEDLPTGLKTMIRRNLAINKIEKAFGELNKPVDDYQVACRKYPVLKAKAQREKKPVPPPPSIEGLQKLAEANGFTFDQTKLMSEWEARDTSFGMSFVGGRFPVWAIMFQTSTFRSLASSDGNAAYFFWKSEDVKEQTPKFTEKGVRQTVLDSWKMFQARDLAEKAAKALADEANKLGKPLKTVVASRPDLRVILPPEFSWLTESSVANTATQPPQISLSTVAGVKMPGNSLMETVFGLEPGKTGVAFNAPKTMVYVVRPSEFTPSYEVRWRTFLADAFSTYSAAGRPDEAKVAQAWAEEIRKHAGFEWGPGRQIESSDAEDQSQKPLSPLDEE